MPLVVSIDRQHPEGFCAPGHLRFSMSEMCDECKNGDKLCGAHAQECVCVRYVTAIGGHPTVDDIEKFKKDGAPTAEAISAAIAAL